jgi:multiple sugar transport system ATP-binding protein
MAGIEIRGLARQFPDGTRALEAVDLDVPEGELLVLVGPSGSGKTTLLRLLAGLDQPTAGTMRLGGNNLAGVPPHRRNVALVFQNLALYSHLRVADNLAFGLDHQGRNKSDIGQAAKLLGIDHLLRRYPAELSGGEQQRVALGRAIVRRPAALLLDEPLSSLDGPTRRGLRRELKQLQRQLGVPTIYVTHDQAEAMALGDRIAVLNRGRLQQVGSPDDVYRRPANRFVAEFFGPQGMNLIEGQLTHDGGTTTFRTEAWKLTVTMPPVGTTDGKVLCGFRPEDMELAESGELCGEVISSEKLGHATYVQVRPKETANRVQEIIVQLPCSNEDVLQPGTAIHLRLNHRRLHWFDQQTGNRLETLNLELHDPN